ncbi:unnamed protein product [Citrullus colocynthis]|uniref:Uncharacterized protein n=1 Tax=Citrullus colocynthis TaxID=252529 RepID=A0ABP0YAY8_9ROSI
MKIKPTFEITLFLLLLLVNSIESRYEPGGQWRYVFADEPLPVEVTKENEDCVEDKKLRNEKYFVKEIEPRPSAMFYPDHDSKYKLFPKDIEPRPSITFYPDDDAKDKLFTKDIKPQPSATFYPNDVQTKSLAKDIEPRPSTTFYPNDVQAKLFAKDMNHDQVPHSTQIAQA